MQSSSHHHHHHRVATEEGVVRVFDYMSVVPGPGQTTSMSPAEIDNLLCSPWAVQAVVRHHPTQAQVATLRLATLASGATVESIRGWFDERAGGGRRRHKDPAVAAGVVILLLLNSRLAELRGPGAEHEDPETATRAVTPATVVCIRPRVLEHLRYALDTVSLRPFGAQPLFPALALSKEAEEAQELGRRAASQLERLCRFVVGADVEPPSPALVEALKSARVMSGKNAAAGSDDDGDGDGDGDEDGDGDDDDSQAHPAGMMVTDAGFRFLLEAPNVQLWTVLLDIVSRSEDRVARLAFLFELGFAAPGTPVPEAALSKLGDLPSVLLELGVLFRWRGHILPSPLAAFLSSPAGATRPAGEAERSGWIILETNYKIYAYTNSDLQVKLLGMFCTLQYQLPNMCVGLVTRDSVRAAFAVGITADQIIRFIVKNAHPIMRKKHDIPPDVAKQIRLWDAERTRVDFKAATLYFQFENKADTRLAADYAASLDALSVLNIDELLFVAIGPPHIQKQIKTFITTNITAKYSKIT